jgi:hypothetical protein
MEEDFNCPCCGAPQEWDEGNNLSFAYNASTHQLCTECKSFIEVYYELEYTIKSVVKG